MPFDYPYLSDERLRESGPILNFQIFEKQLHWKASFVPLQKYHLEVTCQPKKF